MARCGWVFSVCSIEALFYHPLHSAPVIHEPRTCLPFYLTQMVRSVFPGAMTPLTPCSCMSGEHKEHCCLVKGSGPSVWAALSPMFMHRSWELSPPLFSTSPNWDESAEQTKSQLLSPLGNWPSL